MIATWHRLYSWPRCLGDSMRAGPGRNDMARIVQRTTQKKHNVPPELVLDHEAFRFGPGEIKRNTRAAIFLVVMADRVFLLRTKFFADQRGSSQRHWEQRGSLQSCWKRPRPTARHIRRTSDDGVESPHV